MKTFKTVLVKGKAGQVRVNEGDVAEYVKRGYKIVDDKAKAPKASKPALKPSEKTEEPPIGEGDDEEEKLELVKQRAQDEKHLNRKTITDLKLFAEKAGLSIPGNASKKGIVDQLLDSKYGGE